MEAALRSMNNETGFGPCGQALNEAASLRLSLMRRGAAHRLIFYAAHYFL